MTIYAIYVRTNAGSIWRHDRLTYHWGGSLDPYAHEEQLMGWPEPKVFWAEETGPAIGLAPLDS